MTTNNHPAHGPVSLDRLHQIREILSKAAAQSDGGNLGYAMADAVKVIDGAIAAFGADPVAWKAGSRAFVTRVVAEMYACEIMAEIQPLYITPPATVVPSAMTPIVEDGETIAYERNGERFSTIVGSTWNACRSAMLQAGNSPVTPDGWQLVPKEPTDEMNKAGWAAMNEHDAINPTYRAMLAAAPKQEVKCE